MDLSIDHQAFAGRGLALRTAGSFKGPRLGMALPILLVFSGGALGGLFGCLGIYSSARVFRGHRSTAAKFGLSAMISMGAVLGYFVFAVMFTLLIDRS